MADVGTRFETPKLPDGSRIQITEASDDRWLIAIPPGGQLHRAWLHLGIGWNVIAWSILTVIVVPNWPPKGVDYLFIVAFSIAGFVPFAYAFKVRYTRTFVLIRPHQIAVAQRCLWRIIRRLNVGPQTLVVFSVESSSNHQPHPQICVINGHRKVKFGASLSDSEKRWFCVLLRSIWNLPSQVSRIPGFPKLLNCPHCGDQMAFCDKNTTTACLSCGLPCESDRLTFAKRVTEIEPRHISGDSVFFVTEDSPERLALTVRCLPPGPLGILILAMLAIGIVFAGFMIPFVCLVEDQEMSTWLRALFAFTGACVLVMCLVWFCVCAFGKTWITFDRDTLQSEFRIFRTRPPKIIATSEITAIDWESGQHNDSRADRVLGPVCYVVPRRDAEEARTTLYRGVTIDTRSGAVQLFDGRHPEICRQVIGLLKYQWRKLTQS